jgi:hypothetical protein
MAAESGSLYTYRKHSGKWERTNAGLFLGGEKWGTSQYESTGPGGAVPRVNERQLLCEKVHSAAYQHPEWPSVPRQGNPSTPVSRTRQLSRDNPGRVTFTGRWYRRSLGCSARRSALGTVWC